MMKSQQGNFYLKMTFKYNKHTLLIPGYGLQLAGSLRAFYL